MPCWCWRRSASRSACCWPWPVRYSPWRPTPVWSRCAPASRVQTAALAATRAATAMPLRSSRAKLRSTPVFPVALPPPRASARSWAWLPPRASAMSPSSAAPVRPVTPPRSIPMRAFPPALPPHGFPAAVQRPAPTAVLVLATARLPVPLTLCTSKTAWRSLTAASASAA